MAHHQSNWIILNDPTGNWRHPFFSISFPSLRCRRNTDAGHELFTCVSHAAANEYGVVIDGTFFSYDGRGTVSHPLLHQYLPARLQIKKKVSLTEIYPAILSFLMKRIDDGFKSLLQFCSWNPSELTINKNQSFNFKLQVIIGYHN